MWPSVSQSIYCIFITTCTNDLMISRCSPTGDGTELHCSADLFSDTAALCESVWQDKPLHLCLRLVSWLWPSAAGLTHPDVVCTRPGHGWLITPYLPWRIRALIEHGLVTDPFSLSMKGLASALAFPSRWMAAFWARPCCGRAFVSLTDGFGLLNSFQEIVTDFIWQCWWLAGPGGIRCQRRQLQRAGGIVQARWSPLVQLRSPTAAASDSQPKLIPAENLPLSKAFTPSSPVELLVGRCSTGLWLE